MKLPKNLRLRLEFAGSGWRSSLRAPCRCRRLRGSRECSAPDRPSPSPTEARARKSRTGLSREISRERKAIAAAMWENLGRTFAESFRIKTLTESDRIVFEPAEDFDRAAQGPQPFIVCGLHLGNWEILAHGGERLGVSLIGVYQRVSNPHVEALIRSLREPLYGAGLMPKTPMAARSSYGLSRAEPARVSLPISETTMDRLCPSSAAPRGQQSFPRSSPARPVSRFMPALRSAVRARASASASRPFQCRRRTTARRTLSSRRKRCSASTRLSSARRPNSGCGRTESGTNRFITRWRGLVRGKAIVATIIRRIHRAASSAPGSL